MNFTNWGKAENRTLKLVQKIFGCGSYYSCTDAKISHGQVNTTRSLKGVNLVYHTNLKFNT